MLGKLWMIFIVLICIALGISGVITGLANLGNNKSLYEKLCGIDVFLVTALIIAVGLLIGGWLIFLIWTV